MEEGEESPETTPYLNLLLNILSQNKVRLLNILGNM